MLSMLDVQLPHGEDGSYQLGLILYLSKYPLILMKVVIVVLRVSLGAKYHIHITQENQVIVLLRSGLSSSSPLQLTTTLRHCSQNTLPILSGFLHFPTHQNHTMVCVRSPGSLPVTSGSQRLLKFQGYIKVSTSSPVIVVLGVQAGHQKQFLRSVIHTC